MSLKPFPAIRPPSRSGRLLARLLRGVLVLALGLAMLHALLWRWAVGELEAGFERWAAARRGEGWQVAHDAPERGGWPFAATLFVPWPRLGGGAALLPGGVEWQAEGLLLRLSPVQPRRLTLAFLGWQRIFGEGFDLRFAADRLESHLPLGGGSGAPALPVEARRLRLRSPAGQAEVEQLALQVEAPGGAGPAARLDLAASGLLLPEDTGPATAVLGRAVQALQAQLTLTGPLPGTGSLAARAAAWRDGGGRLEAQALLLRWGPLAAEGTARLGLDRALQPAGEAALQLAGADALLQVGVQAGLLTRQAALGGQTLLGLLSRRPATGGAPVLDLPLTLENRVLSAARLRLALLPDWRWPGAPPRP
ncbi:DUF2125 domain-containing protein [Roseicella frigidaeris]|uniref:DUF2125 domain-containing protein n=1 Tax=Roseicella frigidaeris TaxID=2230885 RepID=A0A327M3X5_9PROT|nr:DUF2125 domain-containing protein [Roseicella frigidaeris]RAI57640.1 hypothetical protein DOO78_17745 [Roseicella frigidaeris]